MKINKSIKRDKRRFKNRHGMSVSNKSIFLIQNEIKKRADKIKENREGVTSG